ncbi:MAG: FxLYD domain-containing protein [Ginsengibacter sp.]
MKMLSAILLTLIFFNFSCTDTETKNVAAEKEDYELTKRKLRDNEIKHPETFISVSGSDKHNLLGQTVVKGSITNKATVAIYKDVDVQLDFYSKTGTLLETDKETIYETIDPGQSKNFKTKYFAPKGSDSVALKVLRAKITE